MDFLKGFKKQAAHPEERYMRRSFALPKEVVEGISKPFQYVKVWTCRCGAELKIRAREDRSNGPSNFVAYGIESLRKGHSKIKSSDLTWDGLAEERGWKTQPVECPACQRGLSVEEYKRLKREGLLEE